MTDYSKMKFQSLELCEILNFPKANSTILNFPTAKNRRLINLQGITVVTDGQIGFDKLI